MTKKGKIKYADPVKGYGYILAEDAKDAADTTFFKLDDAADNAELLVSGEDVEFEEDFAPNVKQATKVKVTRT